MMRFLPALLLLVVFSTAGWAQERLLLTFTQGTGGTASHTYGSDPGATTFRARVLSGHQLILQHSSGREYQVQTSPASWAPVQVQEVPRDHTYLAITPRLEADAVTLDIQYSSREGDTSTGYTSTVSGELGQWIHLVQSGHGSRANAGKVYSSTVHEGVLSVKVEREK